ncbi:YbaB/EbfC family nucleoid-associated protein [Lentzea flava]|nr:YbaB/EbfC family nucleoid-associated protein [Lentzea flava]
MQALLQQAQNMQQQMATAQEELANTEVTGNASNLVTATVTGGGELVSLTIDPKIVDPEDVETLQDLVIAAIKDANQKAQQLVEQKLGPLAQGGLGGLLG